MPFKRFFISAEREKMKSAASEKTLLTSLAGLPVIVGSGIAGLSTALHMARPCVLMSAAKLGAGSASVLAQGGMAAAVGVDDSCALHVADTLAAGDGLCECSLVERLIEAAPEAALFSSKRSSNACGAQSMSFCSRTPDF